MFNILKQLPKGNPQQWENKPSQPPSHTISITPEDLKPSASLGPRLAQLGPDIVHPVHDNYPACSLTP